MEIGSRWNLLGSGNRIAHHTDFSDCVLDRAIHYIHDQKKQTRCLEIVACDDTAVIDQPRRDGLV